MQRVVTIPQPGRRLHVSELRWNQLYEGEPFPVPFLPCPQKHRERARAFLVSKGHSSGRPLVAIHPGSGGRRKCWDPEKYERVIEMLREKMNPFFLILHGPAEEGLGARIQGMAAEDVLPVSGKELPEVYSLLGLCDLYLGNDSGISHLAALSGCGVVSIFGPTDPAIWSPRGRSVRVITPEADCSPCDRSAACNNRICLSGTSAERVFLQAAAMLDGRGHA